MACAVRNAGAQLRSRLMIRPYPYALHPRSIVSRTAFRPCAIDR